MLKVGDRVRGISADVKGGEYLITAVRPSTNPRYEETQTLKTLKPSTNNYGYGCDTDTLGKEFHRGCDWTDCLELVSRTWPTFKAGDRVRCTASVEDCTNKTSNAFTHGKIYTVLNDLTPTLWYDTLTIVSDDRGSSINGWCHTFFELVAAPKPHIVARVYGGSPQPSARPFVHTTCASAQAEAERLANANPGTSFEVYALVSRSLAAVQPAKSEAA